MGDTEAPAERPDRTAAHLERAEERLAAEVESREAGRVVVRRTTTTEPETVQVDLRHDEVELDRVKVNRPLARGERPVREAGEETIVLRIEERLETRKVPWVVEEIHVRRRLVTDHQSITEEVRKEHLDIGTTGDVVFEKP